ncbi:TetR/AcrR family transcriptional regulator [Variovorax sp. dw_954]|uniref:TetR/AcrR family transcriptional regulator n=1 Tax=Variovorax sp. dw_954 TaxID=2720078 RepID=UPI001BD5E32D|nr:TetR/AcrR family transcriptional regulator [Variovorax sp. dw_954]
MIDFSQELERFQTCEARTAKRPHAYLSTGKIVVLWSSGVNIPFDSDAVRVVFACCSQNFKSFCILTKPSTPRRNNYHHGSLVPALMEASEAVLRRDGLACFTVRGVAREAGVSHTAFKHHFGDMVGLCSELGARGHLRLAACMEASAQGHESGRPRRQAIARGYISFSVDNPDLFRLMSRQDMLDFNRPALAEAVGISARALAGVFGKPSSVPGAPLRPFGQLEAQQVIAMASGWSLVHGLSMLLIDGRLTSLALAADSIREPMALVEAVITSMEMIFHKPPSGA